MTDENTYDWDQVNLDGYEETVSEEDINRANMEKVPGRFVCLFGKPKLGDRTTKDFTNAKTGEVTKGYMSFEVSLNMKIIDILAVDKEIKGEDGKPLERNGEIMTRIMPVTETEKANLLSFFEGMALEDNNSKVRLKPLNAEDEKETTKNRRIKIANALGILQPGQELSPRDWLKVEGKKAIVNTAWNTWIDKASGDKKKNVQIDFFNGFEAYVETSVNTEQSDDDTDYGDI